MKDKNVSRNMLLNIIKTILSIVFPLITYPYATRVLGPDNFGKVSFGLSIISYLALFASLGISNYAIREGGFYRKNRQEFSSFASEIYSLNVTTTILAYIGLFITLSLSIKLRDYSLVIIIQSLSVLFTTIGVEWVNVIYEDYLYITIRSIIVQVIALIALIVFVKNENDYIIYASINVVNNGLICLLNRIHVKKLCDVSLKKFDIRKHIKPVLILFSNNIAVSIYCNSDITMIGYLLNDYSVGLYSLSTKIYTILKTVIAAAYTVTITRLTEYISDNKENSFKELLNDVFNNIIILAVPIMVGGILFSEIIVRILAGENFRDAVTSLQILIGAVLCAVLGGAIAYCINMPFKREVVNLKCTSFSALENIVLKAILIPLLGINGAAMATFVSELTVLLILLMTLNEFRAYFTTKIIITNTLKCLVASFPIVILWYFYDVIIAPDLIKFPIVIFISFIMYVTLNILLKNESVRKIISSARR